MYGFPPIKFINNNIKKNKEQNIKREYNKTINIRQILANKKNQFIKIEEKKSDDDIEVIRSI
jgi:hypothetical protein